MLRKVFFELKGNKKINIVITVVYFLLHLFVILRHEHWCDEAQAWLITKNLSLFEMFRILPTEGHPCLWFLFIMPFAKLGLSFDHVSFISLAVMTVTVYLFLTYSPFSLMVNIGILFSSVFLFYNPVVFRSYCLIALIIVLIAVFYEKRNEKPILYGILVGLLFQTHVVAFGLGIGLFIDCLIDYFRNNKNRKQLWSLIIMLASFILMVIEIMPRSSLPSGVDTSVGSILNNLAIDNLIKKFAYFAYTAWGMPLGILSLVPYALLISAIVLLFVFITINRSWKNNYQMIIVSICAVGEFFGVLVLVYTPHTQMASILTMILLFLMWQFYNNNKENNIRITSIAMMAIISFFSFIVCQSLLRTDINKQFSQSLIMSNEIEKNMNDEDVLIMENAVNDSPVYCYVKSHRNNIMIYDIRNKEDYVFHQLGLRYDDLSYDYICKTVKDNLGSYKNVYYLTYKEAEDDRFVLVDTTSNIDSVWQEHYYLYKIVNE